MFCTYDLCSCGFAAWSKTGSNQRKLDVNRNSNLNRKRSEKGKHKFI